MYNIHRKVLFTTPDFLRDIFLNLAGEKFLAIDEEKHDQLVAEGAASIKKDDISTLRVVIGQILANRVSTSGDATEIVELAHLIGS